VQQDVDGVTAWARGFNYAKDISNEKFLNS
jgi:hypothetical protein